MLILSLEATVGKLKKIKYKSTRDVTNKWYNKFQKV